MKDLQPKPEVIRDVRTGPDGALYVMTDSAAGRILKLVRRSRNLQYQEKNNQRSEVEKFLLTS